MRDHRLHVRDVVYRDLAAHQPQGDRKESDRAAEKAILTLRLLYMLSYGQPDWRSRPPNGKLPAPPHDESGHTWHHTDQLLFDITKHGLVWPYTPKDYQSDMPAFDGTLADDEIWAVLAYIKSHW
jgi:hypothetical protein